MQLVMPRSCTASTVRVSLCACGAHRRYFQTGSALLDHEGTKPHKRRVKMLVSTPKPHTQVDAEVASGMGRPDNGPKLRSSGPAAMVH
jgi:hypothetical protein